MAMQACRECGRSISTSANPCPHCGKPRPHGWPPVVIYAGGAVLSVAATVAAFAITRALQSPAEPASPAIAPDVAPAAAQPVETTPTPVAEPAEPAPWVQIAAARSFPEALQRARPLMDDALNDINYGAAFLALWMANNGKLSDVLVATDETTIRKAKKDTAAERGKRLCVRGRVLQIYRDGTTWRGNLITGSTDVVNFAVGLSTGDLVEDSYARLCGVVIGEFAFSNVSGGQTRSIQVVGAFDIPENRTR